MVRDMDTLIIKKHPRASYFFGLGSLKLHLMFSHVYRIQLKCFCLLCVLALKKAESSSGDSSDDSDSEEETNTATLQVVPTTGGVGNSQLTGWMQLMALLNPASSLCPTSLHHTWREKVPLVQNGVGSRK